MIRFDDAIAIITSAAEPLPRENVRLNDAVGRVLAEPVIAAIDSPRANVSAMDGYAVRSADLHHYPAKLTLVGEALPGQPWTRTLSRGTCVRIFTGAPVPAGADRVIMQEVVQRENDQIVIAVAPDSRTWIRTEGADFRSSDELVSAGRLIDPATLITIAAGDIAEVVVSAQPRVILLVTGDELVEPGAARMSGFAIPDSLSAGLSALARQWGATVLDVVRLRDDPGAMTLAGRTACEQADVVVVTGGASVGERDFAKAMFAPLGLDLLFSKLAIRPGMPAWFGRAAGAFVLGLPGNPTSALVTARLLLAPLLARFQGRPLMDALAFEIATLASGVPACDARETFHRGTLAGGKAALLSFQESHAQKNLADADALIRQSAHSAPLIPGDIVEVLRV